MLFHEYICKWGSGMEQEANVGVHCGVEEEVRAPLRGSHLQMALIALRLSVAGFCLFLVCINSQIGIT